MILKARAERFSLPGTSVLDLDGSVTKRAW
jgi:hypothetical protein